MALLKVGVIGVGFFGEIEVKALTEIPEAQVVGVADIDVSRAKEVAERHGIPEYFEDSKELVHNVDAVVIASPESAHKEHFLDALSAGCHVLLEKPIASTLEEGQAILDAASQTDRFTTVGYELRFDPRYVTGKKAVEELGALSSIHLCRRGWIDTPKRVKDWTHLLFYSLVHDIDVLRWYTNSEVSALFATSSHNVLGEGYDDCIAAALSLMNGVAATLDGNWVMPSEVGLDPMARAEIFGEKGMVTVHSYDQGVVSCIAGVGYNFPDVNIWPIINGTIQGALKRELEHFVERALNEETSSSIASSIKDGYKSLQVATAIKESIRSGKAVHLG